jgi:hypothetical protein
MIDGNILPGRTCYRLILFYSRAGEKRHPEENKIVEAIEDIYILRLSHSLTCQPRIVSKNLYSITGAITLHEKLTASKRQKVFN